jgi:uncharacterized protein (DUF488 family)
MGKIKQKDQVSLRKFASQTKSLRGKKLLQEVYTKYPEYARKSYIASRVLTHKEYNQMMDQWTQDIGPVLMTIGYEGLSIDAYLNKLISNNINTLVDVRRNPVSRKYGFSKNALRNYIEKVEIQYFHLPELGIPSRLRKNLDGPDSYTVLFDVYESQLLPLQQPTLSELISIIKDQKRVALTCFEANHFTCHRNKLANHIQSELVSPVPIKHL